MNDRLLWIGCALYAALFTWLGYVKYAAHRNLVDFGIFSQTVTSAFGCFCNPLEGSHWAYHFSPILYLAAVAVWLVHSPMTLVALQAAACALCAPPVYALVRARGDVTTARLAALTVLLYPPLAGLTFADFHENGFAPAAIAWALYAFDAGKLWLAAASVAFALSVKEDQAFFLAFAGVVGAVSYRSDVRRARFAAIVVAVSIAVALVFFFLIQPRSNANPGWAPTRFYDWSAADWRALVPAGILQRLGFLLLILAPLAFLPLRTRAIVLALPPLIEVMGSRMSTTFTLGTHYAGAWIGYVLIAFAAGVCDVSKRGRVSPALYVALALCAVELLVANPLHPGLNLRGVQARDTQLQTALHSLPLGMSLATQEEAYTHLAFVDPFATLLPERPATETTACFILTDRDFPDSPRLQEYGDEVTRLVRAGHYVPIARAGAIELYRRVSACQ